MLNVLANSPLTTNLGSWIATDIKRSRKVMCDIGKCNYVFPGPSSTGTAVFPPPRTDRQTCPRDYLFKNSKHHPIYSIWALSIHSYLGRKRSLGLFGFAFFFFFSSFVFSLTSSILCIFLEAKSCEDIQCSAGKKCLWDFKVGRGRCALCDELCPESKSDEAVCASDNTTYPSECAMKEAACSMGVLLEVKHSGSCNCKWDF